MDTDTNAFFNDDVVTRNRYMPYVGYVTIALNDYPKLKYLLLGIMGLSLLFQKE